MILHPIAAALELTGSRAAVVAAPILRERFRQNIIQT